MMCECVSALKVYYINIMLHRRRQGGCKYKSSTEILLWINSEAMMIIICAEPENGTRATINVQLVLLISGILCIMPYKITSTVFQSFSDGRQGPLIIYAIEDYK